MTEQTQPRDAGLMKEVVKQSREHYKLSTSRAAFQAGAMFVLSRRGTPAGAGEPFGYFHQLLNHEGKGNGVWLGAAERKVVEQAHVPGETSEEIVTLYTTPQPTQAQAVVEVPAPQQELVGDASMAHEQCRAVVHLALMLAEVYAANAAIVAHGPNLADQIGYASARALEWIGDELNATDATAEDDEWVDPIIEAAQERWPTTQHVAGPLTEREMAEGWRKFQEDLEARMAADPAGVRSMGREHWLSWAHWKAACYFARSHKGADHA